MNAPALAIMSRFPSPEGKTRLNELLTPEQREALQWAFFLDLLDKVERVPEAKCFLAITPAEEISSLRQIANPGVEIIPQPGGSLGERMLAVTRHVHGLGHSPVILLGTDVPALPPAYLSRAFKLLDRNRLVFGPALDGGYYLIGMRRPEDKVFEDVAWGSESVLQESIAVCERYRLPYSLLEPLRDIDRPEDFLALVRQVERGELDPAAIPFRTVKFIRQNFLLKG